MVTFSWGFTTQKKAAFARNIYTKLCTPILHTKKRHQGPSQLGGCFASTLTLPLPPPVFLLGRQARNHYENRPPRSTGWIHIFAANLPRATAPAPHDPTSLTFPWQKVPSAHALDVEDWRSQKPDSHNNGGEPNETTGGERNDTNLLQTYYSHRCRGLFIGSTDDHPSPLKKKTTWTKGSLYYQPKLHALLNREIPQNYHMGVSKNKGTPKSSILIRFSIINHPFWGRSPYFWFNTHIFASTLIPHKWVMTHDPCWRGPGVPRLTDLF